MNLRTYLGRAHRFPYPSVLAPLESPAGAAEAPPVQKAKSIHMPLSSIGSYLSTSQAFIEHWTQVNTQLGAPANALTLPGGYAVADLIADHDALQDAMDLVIARDNARQVAAGTRDSQKAALVSRLKQFRAAVRGVVAAPGFINALPNVPNSGAAESKFLDPFSDMQELWTQVNAATTLPDFTAPLLLGTYPLATFTADVTALRMTFEAAQSAEEAATIARRQRDALMAALKRHLQQYAKVVVAKLGPADPLVAAIPSLTPAAGSTPAAVSLNGMWDPTAVQAKLAWSASENPRLAHYSVRACAGAYKAANETVVAEVAKDATAYETAWGLAAPGARSSFKVYVVTTMDNEKGSNAVGVTRPAQA